MINLVHRLQKVYFYYLLYLVAFKVLLIDLVSLNHTFILRYLELTWSNRNTHNTRRINLSKEVNRCTARSDMKIRIFDIFI